MVHNSDSWGLIFEVHLFDLTRAARSAGNGCDSAANCWEMPQNWNAKTKRCVQGIIYESWGCWKWGPLSKIGFLIHNLLNWYDLALNALILTDHDPSMGCCKIAISTSSVGVLISMTQLIYESVVRFLQKRYLKNYHWESSNNSIRFIP